MSDSNSNSTSPQNSALKFSGVHKFLFRRKQGFNCVPSRGGTTLGMADRHFDEKVVSFSRKRSSPLPLSSHSDDVDEEEALEVSNEEFEGTLEEKSSLAEIRPLPVRQRRRLLRLSGVKKIDSTERFECEEIRVSRNECGCQTCGAVCLPDTCPCSVNGIACQVDKMAYPCSCTREGCHNRQGRAEFNAIRVRRHLIHTLSKLYSTSNEDSGAVDLDIEGDNSDHFGRCRYCNIDEGGPSSDFRSQQRICEDAMDDVFEENQVRSSSTDGSDSKNEPMQEYTPVVRTDSPAVVASKMLRRKWNRHWRQQAQVHKPGHKLVNKLVLMRRAMASSLESGSLGVSEDSPCDEVRR